MSLSKINNVTSVNTQLGTERVRERNTPNKMGSVFSCVLDDDALDKHELERLNMLKKGEREANESSGVA